LNASLRFLNEFKFNPGDHCIRCAFIFTAEEFDELFWPPTPEALFDNFILGDVYKVFFLNGYNPDVTNAVLMLALLQPHAPYNRPDDFAWYHGFPSKPACDGFGLVAHLLGGQLEGH
jgi:hypothetical protein